MLLCVSSHATDFDDISVKIESVTESRSSSGYDEYRVTISNRSLTKSHRVTVEIYGGAYRDFVGAIKRSVDVAPNATVTVSIFKPQGSVSLGWGIVIDGKRQNEGMDVDVSRTSAMISHSQNEYYTLISRNVEKIDLMNDAGVVEGFKSASGESDVAYLAYKSPMSEWSGNWIGYSGFDAMFITAEEMREAPESVRAALLRYVECGGAMVLIGQWDVPKSWQAWRKTAPGNNETYYSVGFGRIVMIDAARVKQILPAVWGDIKQGWKGPRHSRKVYYDVADINKDFSVVDRIGIPVRGLFVLMLAFVIVIGPVNLIWLARKRKKIWMLWTVPAISLLTCLAVTGFALFGEGVSATARTESLTILDESGRRATTIGWAAFYSPITQSEGLHFSYDTELTPVMPEAWSYQSGASRTFDFSNDQHLDSGWVMARIPAYFRFRKSETRRERLTIKQAGTDSVEIVNGLGADIRQVWVADRSGKIYKAENVRAGAPATLSLTGLRIGMDDLREPFRDANWPEKMKYIEQNAAQYLTPGTYLAALDASPFVEDGLKDVKSRKAHTLVYGISAEAER
jgi:hypothetical protein